MPLGFESSVWLWLAAAAFALGHLVVLAYFVRASADRSGPSTMAPPEFSAEAEPGTPAERPRETGGSGRRDADSGELPPVESDRIVQCPHCGVENAAEFRFCRFCVGELAGGATISDPGGTSRDGQAF